MAKFLRLTNGVPRSFTEGASVTIYDQSLSLVAPVNTGVSVTLPGGQTYTAAELQIYLNGDRLESVFDYSYVGSAPRTQVQFTFPLVVGDRLDFRIDRAP